MHGSRGIWQDGWKAVTRHVIATEYSDAEWELYHLDEDFSELNNLAEQEPERLRALIDRWWIEASREASSRWTTGWSTTDRGRAVGGRGARGAELPLSVADLACAGTRISAARDRRLAPDGGDRAHRQQPGGRAVQRWFDELEGSRCSCRTTGCALISTRGRASCRRDLRSRFRLAGPRSACGWSGTGNGAAAMSRS